jgi:ATP-dependent DNA helicase PIF1
MKRTLSKYFTDPPEPIHNEAYTENEMLSPTQQKVYDMALNGETFFFSGPAGSGKSYVLQKLVDGLENKYAGYWGKSVYVTAPTGIAAANVGGTTIHIFAGYGLNLDIPFDTLILKIQKFRGVAQRWKRAKVLIIDEVSMLSSMLLELLDKTGRWFKDQNKPFGGLQLILSGDFYQLPPVQGDYCFLSPVWKWKCVLLNEVYRQSDPEFIKFLSSVREGRVVNDDILKPSKVEDEFVEREVNGLTPTKLFCVNIDVDAYNLDKLENLQKLTNVERVVFESKDTGTVARLESLNVPQKLELCIGCQVLLLQNCPRLGLFNGSLGKVCSIHPAGSLYNGHTTSGTTSFEGGPVVRFENNFEVLINKRIHEIFQGEEVVATRRQYPLRLGWALSIHKSQGMTLPLLDIDLTRSFATGQSYVAISRARTIEGLRVRGFDKKKVKADPRVIEFYMVGS